MQVSTCDTVIQRSVRPRRADRIPLGLGPWLPRLRSGSLRLVRRLHSYYGLARLPTPVHHRLRLLAFPMRTGGLAASGQTWDLPVSDTIFPCVMCSSTPAGWTVPRITVPPMWRSTVETVSAPSDKDISWLNHTPHAAAVYASWPSLPPAHATLASRRLARPYLGWTFTSRSRQPSWPPSSTHPTAFCGHPLELSSRIPL